MPGCVIAGAGLAGLSCAVALAEAGFWVRVLEAKPFPGGRATSYSIPGLGEIDNGQHILLRCCTNLLDFYRRLGVESSIDFHREFRFLEPGGRMSRFRAGWLPAPFHFAGDFLRVKFLNLPEKMAIGRAMLAVRSEYGVREDLDRISMLEWLRQKRQPERAIQRFWRPVLVSAINVELDEMAAAYGQQVIRLGFQATADSYEIGIPKTLLGQLCVPGRWRGYPRVSLEFHRPVREILQDGAMATGMRTDDGVVTAEYYVSAVPFETASGLAPGLDVDFSGWGHSSITTVHLWFDRPVTNLPHGALLDRTIHWFFNKDRGRYLQVVISASDALLAAPARDVVAIALNELKEFLPVVQDAKLERARVVKEARATIVARPGLDHSRPGPRTRLRNFFLAGDWTRTGWPSTMEGAVRSGYLAAEAITEEAGSPRRFLVPDIA